jgi:hypothetical protein
LLFYYWQIIAGVLMTFIFLGIGLQSCVPESYDSSTTYYLTLAALAPSLCMLFIQAMLAIMLLHNRTWKMLKLLRTTILVSIGVEAITFVINAVYLKDDLSMTLGALSLASYTAFAIYFFRSKRVRHVFNLHDWSVAVQKIYPEKVVSSATV